MNMPKAVILAAGEGRRMRPLTLTRPKVMLPIANKPILEHVIVEMQQAGISEFIFVVGYHDEQIRNYFGNGEKWGVGIRYIKQKEQLGTADALAATEGLLNETFLLANGDAVIGHQDIIRLTKRYGNVVSTIELSDISGLGVIKVKSDYVVKIYEKMQNPPSHLVNAGLYLFSPDIFDAIKKIARSPRGEYELTDAIQMIVDSGQKVSCQEIHGWLNVSYPWDLLAANEEVMAKLEPQISGQIEENVVINGPVSVGQDTIIRSGAYITGPVIIGRNCEIGPNCYIRPVTVVADGCHIGAAVEVKNSIIMSGSKIPHLSYVGDSVIGENCNLGAGTKIANLRLDEQTVKIGDLDTKRRKLGAIIGDNVKTGINSCINTGAVIGNDTFIGHGARASGIIPPGSKIK